jgi:calpain
VQNLRRDQDYMTLARQCRQSGRLWEDSAFPASSKVLTDGNMIVSYFGRRQVRDDEIQWLRPRDICKAMNLNIGPAMIVGERDRFDINQGEIGDCWFLAALANLADNEEMFDRVVPSGQGFDSNYCGIFRFRFFRFGEWVEVCVDDRLPTRHGQLIYIKAKDKNEFWSPLLEKAYAKLYGSYKALEGGLTIEAAVDFTGGIPEMINLSTLTMQPETLFYTMVKAYQANAFMSCSLSNSRQQRQAEQLGLQARHAYTITKVVEVRARGGHKGTIPLIRLRNPHGNGREWKGDWSDQDREWRNLSSSVKESLGLTFDNDGEFYMSFNRDFLKYFGEVEIVHLTPTSMVEDQRSKVKYEVFYFHGEWRGQSAGGCGNDHVSNFVQNPQFVFSLTDPDPRDDKDTCPVIISLAQKVKERKTEHAIGFRVYKLPPGQSQMTAETVGRSQPVGKTDQYINLREVSKRLQLPPGNYCIIPTTFRPGQESKFLVRTFVERHWGASGQAAGQSVADGQQGAEGGHGHQLGPRGMTRNVINIPILREDGSAPAPPAPAAGGGNEGRKKGKREQMADFAIGQIEKRYPKAGSFLAKLREWYSFPKDRDQEMSLLKVIVDSVRK